MLEMPRNTETFVKSETQEPESLNSPTPSFFFFNKNTEAISQASIGAIQANSPGLWRQGWGGGGGGEGSCTVPLESRAAPLDPQEEAV